jgi:peptide/nickel transport system ATP-binding protein
MMPTHRGVPHDERSESAAARGPRSPGSLPHLPGGGAGRQRRELRPPEGERFGLVGESGSGKSTIALALLRLIRPPGRIEGGEIRLEGTDLLRLSLEEMRQVRLARIALVAQGAMNSLNPVARVREQIRDGLKDHGVRLTGRAFDDRVAELLNSVGLRKEVAGMFPHELSGGMKQRVCMAIAISLRPKLIIADEPTSALDVVVQRQVMDTCSRSRRSSARPSSSSGTTWG